MSDQDLTLGATGKAVASLQKRLIEHGFPIRGEELAARVFGPGTEQAVKTLQKEHGLKQTGSVDDRTRQALDVARPSVPTSPVGRPGTGGSTGSGPSRPPAGKDTGGTNGTAANPPDHLPPEFHFLVRGQALYRHGKPIEGLAVAAFHKGLRRDVELGDAKTDADGKFEIYYNYTGPNYASPSHAPGQTGAASGPDLVVRVFDHGVLRLPKPVPRDQPVAESAVIFGAQRIERVRLQIDGAPETIWSEFDQLLLEVGPHLDGADLAQLTELPKQPDVSLLAGKTSQTQERVAALVLAHKLAGFTDIDPEIYYGLLRQQQPSTLATIAKQHPDVSRHALRKAIATQVIPARLAPQVDQFGPISAKIATTALVGTRDRPTPLASTLGTVLKERRQVEKFANAYVSHRGSIKSFWKTVAKDPELNPHAETLQLAMQATALAGGSSPMVGAIVDMLRTNNIAGFRDLARFGEKDWRRIIGNLQIADDTLFPQGIVGSSRDEKVALYASTIARILTDALPTDVIAWKARTDDVASHDLRIFWRNVTDTKEGFQFGRGEIGRHLEAHPKLLDGVADKSGLLRDLKRQQRLFSITPVYEEMKSLHQMGIGSAQDAARMGSQVFLGRAQMAGIAPERAVILFEKAQTISAAALQLFASYSPVVNNIAFNVLQPPSSKDIPNLETLFGSSSLCNCDDCISIDGPAAYFADILAYLGDRPQSVGQPPAATTARDILFSRRPDLGDLELTCINIDTPMPYVDLANEILEEAVAPFQPFDLPADIEDDLNSRTLTSAVIAAFAQGGVPLGPNHVIYAVTPSASWFVTDHSRLYVIAKDSGSGHISVLRAANQTGATAAELAANPEHVNTAAYDILRGSLFPWMLPLDLWWEETRVYLHHLGADRAQLMADFTPSSGLADPRIAGEALGLSMIEQSIITGGRPVKLAAALPVAPLSGLAAIDGVAPAAGDRVILTAQADPHENGIYVVAAGGWTRATDPGSVDYAAVTAGNILAKSTWVVRDTGAVTVTTRARSWDHWGLQQNGNPVEVFDAGSPAGSTVTPLGWLEAISHVREMLARSGLAYTELLDLLETQFINPASALAIVSVDPADPTSCDTLKLKITNLTEAVSLRMMRFVRLWRRLGWSMSDLDKAIGVLAAGIADIDAKIDDTLVVGLRNVEQLRQRFGLAIDQTLSFWSKIDTTGTSSLYARLFLNLTVVRPVDAAFALNPAGTELAIVVADPAKAKIGLHVPTIAAAFGISAQDLASLQAALLADDTLSLGNLSILHRHALLAAALGLSIPDMIALRSMSGLDPFDAARTHSPLLFADLATRLTAAGFDVPTLDYLLFHLGVDTSTIAPDEGTLAAALSDIRSGLAKIRSQTTSGPDPDGSALRRALIAARWPASLVEDVISLLAGRTRYAAPLAALPTGVTIPAALRQRVAYDAASAMLTIVGPLTKTESVDLAAVSGDADWHAAVAALFAAPRDFGAMALRAYEWPVVTAPLAALPSGIAFSDPLARSIYFDIAGSKLSFNGFMTDADRATLLALSADAAYQTAVQALYDAGRSGPVAPANRFLDGAGVDALFDTDMAPTDRFTTLLTGILTRQRQVLSTRLVVTQLCEAFRIDLRVMERLLTVQIPADVSPGKKAIDDLLDPAFAESNPAVALTAAAFPAQFHSVIRLHKVAYVVRQLRLTTNELDWIAANAVDVAKRVPAWLSGAAPAVGWLEFGSLPSVAVGRDPAAFGAWMRLIDLIALRNRLPGGGNTLSALLSIARDPSISVPNLAEAIAQGLADRSKWAKADILAILTNPGLGLVLPADVRDETGLTLVLRCLASVRRLKAAATQVMRWTLPQPSRDDASAARNAARAVHSESDWLKIAKDLRDELRQRQRIALVGYLSCRPYPDKGQVWHDANGLYEHFLIDVEMCPCMITSRLKQAISSVQLFVQRALLNLDPAITVDEAKDAGWTFWRNLSSFRLWEAERKILFNPENWMQLGLRDDKTPFYQTLESALMQDDVTSDTAEDAFTAYLEKLDEVARLEVAGMYHEPASEGEPDVLHVFGRTHGTPPTYYYRRWIGRSRWTAWEAIDLDINAQQIIPVVWNRRLMLFWPVFSEVADDVTTPPDKPTPPTRHFEIQLAWSELKRGKWRSKKTTPETMKIRSEVALDTSLPDHGISLHTFRAGFDGPGLKIWYEFDDPHSFVTLPYGSKQPVGAANVQGFFFRTRNGPIEHFHLTITGVYQPTGTKVDGMFFTEAQNTPLYLPNTLTGTAEGTALGTTPGTFRLSYPHQDGSITGSRPFFFEDPLKAFAVEPTTEANVTWIWTQPDWIDPVFIGKVMNTYYTPPLVIDPLGPIERLYDPTPVERIGLEKIAASLPPRGTEGARLHPPADRPQSVAITAAGLRNGTAPAVKRASAASTILDSRMLSYRQQSLTSTSLTWRREATQEIMAQGRQPKWIISKGDRAVYDMSDYLSDQRVLESGDALSWIWYTRGYWFHTFYHPYATQFLQLLGQGGVDMLLKRDTQLMSAAPFVAMYSPTALVSRGDSVKKDRYPLEDVDFTFGGAYSQYNWELFFYIPLLIAQKLSSNQRFEDARRWFHYIFDPTDTSLNPSPQRYWRTRPFFQQSDYMKQRIETIIAALASGTADAATQAEVAEWRTDPANPFAVARLRTVAFQKMVVMSYLDNLIAWGDQLFRRDTIEAINEATQLYVLAAEILGPRPALIPPRAKPQVRTYNTLAPTFDALSDKLVDIEYLFASPSPDAVIQSPGDAPMPLPKMLYFCVPRNEQLMGYWDKVADRLFKIRNCMNIEGVVRQLPLFEPPIDPALLVKAAAAGIDLSTVLDDVNAPLGLYRFTTMAAKATEICHEVKALGASLLAALERRDTQAIARLQSQNEVNLLVRGEQLRQQQFDEATQQIEVLHRSRNVAVARYQHYQSLLGVQSPAVPAEGANIPDATSSANATIVQEEGIRMLQHEQDELSSLSTAHVFQEIGVGHEFAAAIASAFPTLSLDVKPWGLGTGMSWGGPNIGSALHAIGVASQFIGNLYSYSADRAGRLAHFIVREHDWVMQSNIASRDIMMIDQQLVAARIRQSIAQTELTNHRKQTEDVQAVDDYLRSMYTSTELYDYLVGQITAVYFQSYQLAYDLAKRTERVFRHELGLRDSNYITFGYWDSVRKGLLSGERLMLDLKRMESAYLEQNRREFEIVKHVSLASLHPEALVSLRETGTCYVELPEPIFDLDHPGHYMRRIRSVAVTIPCTTGPYTSIGCKLTLLSNRTRVDSRTTPAYAWQGVNDARFVQNVGGIEAIVTSSAREDAGVFAEQAATDPRFQPFEGAGAISSWQLELPADFRQFDYRSISDVVLHIRYTARDGDETLKQAALAKLGDLLKAMEIEQGKTGLFRSFSARRDLGDQWQRFLYRPAGQPGPQTLELPLGPDRFPVHLQDRALRIDAMLVVAQLKPDVGYDNNDPLGFTLKPPAGTTKALSLQQQSDAHGGLPADVAALGGGIALSKDKVWTLALSSLPAVLTETVVVNGANVDRLDPNGIEDVVVICHYTF